MLVWDGLILLAALLDGMRLPAASQLAATRSWSNAPALDSETEIELTLENQGRTIVHCRLVDDMPPALARRRPFIALLRFPGSRRGYAIG